MRRVLPLVLLVLFSACGKKETATTPTPTPTPTVTVTPTRIINVTGDLAFGNANINTTIARTFTVSNSGNSTLTFTGMFAVGGTMYEGFTPSPLSGSIAAGGSARSPSPSSPRAIYSST